MKTISLLLSTLVILFSTPLDAQQYRWLESIHGPNDTEGLGMCVDQAGSPVCCGYFTGDTLYAGNSQLLKKAVGYDTYIIKYDLSGNPLWMHNPGGYMSQVAYAVAADLSNNIFLGGYYQDDFGFGNSQLHNTSGRDAMLLKYDSEGNECWGICMTSQGQAETRYIQTDHEGNIIVGGRFYDHSLHLDDTALVNQGSLDIFIAKYNACGELLWARSFGGSDEDYIMGLCTDHAGNVYISSGFHSKAFTIGSEHYTNYCDKRAALIIQLSSEGELLWSEKHDEGYDQQFMAIGTDSAQNLYAGGYYKGAFQFGQQTLTNSAGHFDVFLAKYDASHQAVWVRQISSEAYERTDNIAVDRSGNVIIELVTFGDICFENTTLEHMGKRDLAIGKYDPSGQLLWAFNGGGVNNDRSFGMAMGPYNNLYLTGYTKSPAFTLGPFELIKNDTSDKDAYICALGPGCPLPDPGFTFQADSMLVQFTATGTAEQYHWDFGDGDTANLPNPSHLYSSFGNYTVSLSVMNACGRDSSSQVVRLCEEPLAGFTMLPNNLTISFLQQSQLATDYHWDFGDGSHSVEYEPVHTYPEYGLYVVCLTATSQCGSDQHYDTACLQAPMCAFSFIIEEDQIRFTDESLDAFAYFWEFGDGATSREQHPVHHYRQSGIYRCCLTIENEYGEFTFCDSIAVETVNRPFFIHTGPGAETLTVHIPDAGRHQLNVYNTSGVIALEYELYAAGQESRAIDISKLRNGVYILELRSDQGIKKQKFMVSRL